MLEPLDGRTMVAAGVLLLAFAMLAALFPHLLIYPLVILSAWIAVTLLDRGYSLHGTGREQPPRPQRTRRR